MAIIPDDADATRLGLEPDSVDLAVTSPPYLDSVDYPYNMMLEYFWLGPLLGIPDRRSLQRPAPTPDRGQESRRHRLGLPDACRGSSRSTPCPLPAGRRPRPTSRLMERHFGEVARCLKPGARYVFVVGNSQTLVDMVPLHDALVRLAAGAGLSLERAFGYRIRRHYMKFPRNGRGGIILIDWVLVLRTAAVRSLLPGPYRCTG